MSESSPRIRVTGGGEPDAKEHAVILEAISRVLAARDAGPGVPGSPWALAGRLEGVGMHTVRARSALPR